MKTPSFIKNNYIKLWQAVENGTVERDFFILRENFRSSMDCDGEFLNFCDQDLIFDSNAETSIRGLYMAFCTKYPGLLGKKHFSQRLKLIFPTLKKIRRMKVWTYKGVRIR